MQCPDPPRYSQHFHLLENEPKVADFSDVDLDSWSDRCCGLASLRSILAFHQLPVPSQTELLQAAIAVEAFGDRGMIHAKLVALAETFGLHGEAMAVDDLAVLADLAADGCPSIISVTHQLPEDGRRGGHLIVFAGWADSHSTVPASTSTKGERLVRFVDPSRWGKDHNTVPLQRISASYSGRCILLKP